MEIGGVGTDGSGELDGVGEIARLVESVALSTDCGIVGHAGLEAVDHAAGQVAGVDLVEGGVEDMEVVADIVLCRSPGQGDSPVGDIVDAQAFGSQTGDVVAVEGAVCPMGDACAVAELANAVDIVGVGVDAGDVVLRLCDVDLVDSP